MTVKNYQDLPSSAIKNIVIDTENNTVSVEYTSNSKKYTYSTEDADGFDQQLLAEFDSEDISVGRFMNQSVSNGTLTLLADWPYHTINKFVKGWLHQFGYQHPLQTIVDTSQRTFQFNG